MSSTLAPGSANVLLKSGSSLSFKPTEHDLCNFQGIAACCRHYVADDMLGLSQHCLKAMDVRDFANKYAGHMPGPDRLGQSQGPQCTMGLCPLTMAFMLYIANQL